MITQKELKKVIQYYPKTGKFFWKVSRSGIKLGVGSEAGSVDTNGYINIMINRKLYRSARLAWLYMEGYWPENLIDHEDRDKQNNKWDNLRETNKQCNARNTGIKTSNTSGITGVSWCGREQRWRSFIIVYQKFCSLGYTKDLTEAVCTRLAAEQSLNWEGCDSTSPAYLYVKEHVQNF